MILFLASNIGGVKKVDGKKIPIKLFNSNDFLVNLKKNLKKRKKFVMIASDPNNYESNDFFLKIDIEALKLSGIVFEEYLVLDGRTTNVEETLSDSNLIFLCGGDTYIQNKFFNDINLKKYIKSLDSIVVGISAGSINAAENVYNSPERVEALENPIYLKGLDLTNINIEPHFNLKKLKTFDKNFQRKELIKESYNRVIYALTDGAYILQDNDSCKLYGESYKITNGNIVKMCDDGECHDIFIN